MSNSKRVAKVTLKSYNINMRDKTLSDLWINLPATNEEIFDVLDEVNKNVLLESLSPAVEWLNDEDTCFQVIDMYGSAVKILFQLNEFCKRLDKFSMVQKRKLYGGLLANSGIEGPDGIGPWHPDLVHTINITYMVDDIGVIKHVPGSCELGEYVIRQRLLPEIKKMSNAILKLLDRNTVARNFQDKLVTNSKLKNSIFVDEHKPSHLHGFYYNLPFLKDIQKRYDGELPDSCVARYFPSDDFSACATENRGNHESKRR